MTLLDTLQIFHGEVSPARARIYARLPRPIDDAGWRLAGRVSGPSNALASTLSATVLLRDLGPGSTFLAEAMLPDPCFWSPESPALYEVEVSLLDEQGERRETAVRPFGIRRLGIRGANFYFEGKRWVLRGADRAFEPAASATAWREAWCSPLTNSPDDAFLEDASRLGVPVFVGVGGRREEIIADLHRLSRFAAVAAAVIFPDEPLDESIASAAPNLLLGCGMSESESSPPAWAQFIFGVVEEPQEFTRRFSRLPRPVVAQRRWEGSNLSDARAACDELQRDLAPFGDYAGYVVVRSYDISI